MQTTRTRLPETARVALPSAALTADIRKGTIKPHSFLLAGVVAAGLSLNGCAQDTGNTTKVEIGSKTMYVRVQNPSYAGMGTLGFHRSHYEVTAKRFGSTCISYAANLDATFPPNMGGRVPFAMPAFFYPKELRNAIINNTDQTIGIISRACGLEHSNASVKITGYPAELIGFKRN